jgi:thiaminase (transcriptional activator TenA)
MGTSDDLRAAAAGIWDEQHRHPFVTGIGDGSLDLDRFAFWVRQDYLFLIEYSRLLALGAARAPDLATMRRLADLARETLGTEMDLHRSYAAELGIAAGDLEAETMAPTTQGYTDFLVRTAAHGDFAELVAALLPCMWGFSEVGRTLAARGRPEDPRYAAWVDMYASDEFAGLAGWSRELTDRVGDGAGPAARAAMERAFITSSRYELAFWDMAWRLERWPG